MVDLKQVISGVFTKTCKLRAEGDRHGPQKVFHIRVTFANVTLGDIISKAIGAAIIQWQAPKRKVWGTLRDGSSFDIMFSAPGRTAQDPMDMIIAGAKAAGMTLEAYIAAEKKRRGIVDPVPPKPLEDEDEEDLELEDDGVEEQDDEDDEEETA